MSSFGSNSGVCRWRGPPGYQVTFARSECFQPPFATNSNTPKNCVKSWSVRGSCMYDAECPGVRDFCENGKCANFNSGNPKVVAQMPWTQMEQFANATGVNINQAPGKDMYLVERDNETAVVVPLSTDRVNPQCGTCLRTIWNCNRFKPNSQKFQKCKSFSKCFYYDTVRPDGRIIPVAVKATPECLAAGHSAIQKCATKCGQVQPHDVSSMFSGPGRFG